jgi:hypothetical protein
MCSAFLCGSRFKTYHHHAGGWGAAAATAKVLLEQSVVTKGSRALLAMNQPGGFKCPSCAFPDPDCKKTLEFCENGAKAPAFEATKRRITLEFLAEHSVSELMEQSDYWLEMQGRLSSNWRAGSTLATSKGVACVQVLEKTQLAGDQRRPQLQQVPLPLSWIGGQATVP